MQGKWPSAKLADLMWYRNRFVTIDDTTEYRRVTARLHAGGVVLRDRVVGNELRIKEQQVCKAGDFLVAEIDAKVGGFGIVPDELDGAIVSSHYFLFEIDTTKLEKEYLSYFIKTGFFQDQIRARGSTNYAAIRPEQVLALEIPLPPREEQRRVVLGIRRLVDKIDHASNFRRQSLQQVGRLALSISGEVFSKSGRENWRWVKLRDVILRTQYGLSKAMNRRQEGVPIIRMNNITYDGRLDLSDMKYAEVDGDTLKNYLLYEGDILFNRTNSRELVGKTACFHAEEKFIFASYLIRVVVDKSKVLPDFVATFLNSGMGKEALFKLARPAIQMANINAEELQGIEVPLPPLSEQQRVVRYLGGLREKVNELQEIQSATETEIDKLKDIAIHDTFASFALLGSEAYSHLT